MISSFLTKYFFYYLLVVTINNLFVQYMKLDKVHLEHKLENIWTIKIFLHHTLKKIKIEWVSGHEATSPI